MSAIVLLALLVIARSASPLWIVRSTGNGESRVLALPADFGATTFVNSFQDVLVYTENNGCSALPLIDTTLSTLMVLPRGGCSFLEKSLTAENAGAKGVFISNNDSSIFKMSSGDSVSPGVSIVVAMVDNEAAKTLSGWMSTGGVTLEEYTRPIADPSIFCLLIIACAVVWGGAYWGSAKERATSKGMVHVQDPDIFEEDVQVLQKREAISFIVCASVGLVVMFFFINFLIYILLVLFALGGANALMICLAPLARRVHSCMRNVIQVPLLGDVEVAYCLLAPFCYAISCTWFITRNSFSGAWILQDVMGIALMLLIQRIVQLRDIRVATWLLGLAFIYDIFWVFLSPYLFNKSVMVTVATGGDSGEVIPMLLQFPRLTDKLGGFSLLGFGDMALPGLLISYLLRFDYTRGKSYYFPISMTGYFMGLLITDCALIIFKSGQPALLYIVPCTLGLVLAIAINRDELGLLWGNKERLHQHLSDEEEGVAMSIST